jgi:benzodiazapine receptor
MTDPSLRLPDDPDPHLPVERDEDGLERPLSFGALIKLGAALLIVMAASYLGQIATMRGLGAWYNGLAKASFNPPAIAFPIAWTLLYGLMAWALWRIWRAPPDRPGRTAALIAFAVQLALNVLWSWVFFGARNPLGGLFVILALEATIVMMIARFWIVDRSAALSQLPYAAWVAFASVLNAAVWYLN